MADRRVRYVLEVDYDGKSVLLGAADDLRVVDDAATEAGEGLARAETGFSKLQAGIVTAQSALGIAEQGFAALQSAAQFAYETLSEGSAIVDARGDFEDLAASVGSTADALEGELSNAAAGLVTDAELIGQAGELMALGLGLSREEIVSLTGVAAELDWNFKTLTDTLNTGSTRGLKELGLSIDEVKSKMAELEASGMSADEAFRMAIIEAAEEKIGRVGKRSEEASGQLEILENTVANVQDEFARGAAEGFAAALGQIAGGAPAAGEGMEAAARGAGSLGAELLGYASINLFGGTLEYLIEYGQELQAEEEAEIRSAESLAHVRAVLAETTTTYGEEQEALIALEAEQADAVMLGSQARKEYAETMEWNARAAAWMREEQERAAVADYARAQQVAELAAQQDLATQAAQAWAEYTAQATALGGDYFTAATQMAQGTWDVNEAMYNAADAYGAGAAALSDIGVDLNIFNQGVADAATAQAQQQIIIENLAGAAASGQILWENFTGAVERAFEVLEGAPLVDLGPRPRPEIEEQGFRAELNEIEMEPIPLEVELQNEAIQAAVDEAKGIVEGFTSPEEAYMAVMDMDITEFVAKAGSVQTILGEIPETKNVHINISAEGMNILEELRALGALP